MIATSATTPPRKARRASATADARCDRCGDELAIWWHGRLWLWRATMRHGSARRERGGDDQKNMLAIQ